jgi:hypothetical protein
VERSVNLFPDTMIAIVALSIGLDAGGSSDLTAVLLMQELFDPKGRVEIMPLVDREIEVRSADWESMMADWRKRHSVSRQGHPLQDYIGRYRGLGSFWTRGRVRAEAWRLPSTGGKKLRRPRGVRCGHVHLPPGGLG